MKQSVPFTWSFFYISFLLIIILRQQLDFEFPFEPSCSPGSVPSVSQMTSFLAASLQHKG